MGRRPWLWLLLLPGGATEAGGMLLPCCAAADVTGTGRGLVPWLLLLQTLPGRCAVEDATGGREGLIMLSLCE